MPVQILSIGAGYELVPAVVRIFFLFRVEDLSVFVTGDKRGGAPGVFEVSNSMVDTTVKSEDSKRMSKEEMVCS